MWYMYGWLPYDTPVGGACAAAAWWWGGGGGDIARPTTVSINGFAIASTTAQQFRLVMWEIQRLNSSLDTSVGKS